VKVVTGYSERNIVQLVETLVATLSADVNSCNCR